MTTETSGMGIKHKGSLLFGIILLLIGLVASFFPEVKTDYDYNLVLDQWVEISRTSYPYQGIGIVLVLAGIIFIAIGFFYSPKKGLIGQG